MSMSHPVSVQRRGAKGSTSLLVRGQSALTPLVGVQPEPAALEVDLQLAGTFSFEKKKSSFSGL